ncbi:MAG: 3-deoxy-manno-octulosonate cytidylyltransferase [Pelotomaculum sp. PtaU1.Bin035]|nr:MAG: 3-deoxy-manno-octulosonate cytidylyltransferase [Pelotomaculum sp. PtaU1.Bin035]
MRTVAIIQARISSTRLPGKVLLMLADKTVLAHVIERCQGAHLIDEVIVATTTKTADDPIEHEAKKYHIPCYRGSEDDVLRRYYEAAKTHHADKVVRITSDCPVLDPVVMNQVVSRFMDEPVVDYCSNTLERSFPRGLDTEVFSFDALEKAFIQANKSEEREHVTPYIYKNPRQFKLRSYENDVDFSNYRWTLDTEADWQLITEIFRFLYTPGQLFYWQKVIQLMQQHPELALINAHVEQKKLGEL